MAVLLVITGMAANAEDGQKVVSKVQKVTVFLNGAQVTRTAMVTINPGTTDLVFSDISPEVDAQSLQVHADGAFTILSVRHELNYLSGQFKSKQVQDLEAMQKELQDKINLQNNLLSIYQTEEGTLMRNQFVKAENQTLDVLKLKEALDFQTQRLTSIREKELAINNQIAELNNQIQKYYSQINEINERQSATTSNIIVTVSSKTALQAPFSLSYIIRSAGWYPSYDIRAKNVKSPLNISYNANVSQKSGEEWKNVRLSLSTGNLTTSSNKPELYPFYLNFPSKVVAGGSGSGSLAEVVVTRPTAYQVDKKEGTLPVEVTREERQTNFEFTIENPYTVQTDGKVCMVEINQVEVKATFQYYVAPKINTDVFLTAKVTDWNKYNFLSGRANLFFEGTYIGVSHINTQAVNDTLNLSLGVDKGIIVKRILQKDLSEKQTFGSNRKETRDWRIEVKNRKNQPVNLIVEDQVPVSQNSSIDVEVQETSGAKPDALTGKVVWNFLLNSQDEKKVQLKYLVKYPKNQSVIVE